MANKPDKFGIKFWSAFDVEFEYIPKAIPYFGKDDARPATQRLSESVIIKIVEPYLDKERSVTTDNFLVRLILLRSSKKERRHLSEP